jgi:hypothetical protein
MDLIASYVGQSSALVNKKMEEARGGVLFIDEAYGLDPTTGGNMFAKDALEMMLANATDPKYLGKMMIILAGYPHQMDRLMGANPGLPRRFTERIDFKSWEPSHCVSLVAKMSSVDRVDIPVDLSKYLVDKFDTLMRLEGWGNAGDVITVYEKMKSHRNRRSDDEGFIEGPYLKGDVDGAFQELYCQRRGVPASDSFLPPPPPLPAATLNSAPPVVVAKIVAKEEAVVSKEEEDDSSSPPMEIDTAIDDGGGNYFGMDVESELKPLNDVVEDLCLSSESSISALTSETEVSDDLSAKLVSALVERGMERYTAVMVVTKYKRARVVAEESRKEEEVKQRGVGKGRIPIVQCQACGSTANYWAPCWYAPRIIGWKEVDITVED